MTDEPMSEYQDVDRDGIPDVLDVSVDPAPDQLAPMTETLTEEQVLEMQDQADKQRLLKQTLTNVQQMQHESVKGITDNLRG
jgi:cell division protein FtsX